LLLSTEKQERGEKGAGASLATGVRLGALNEAHNLTSTNSDTSKRTAKMTTQNKEAIDNERRYKNLTLPLKKTVGNLVSLRKPGKRIVIRSPSIQKTRGLKD
jgi:microcystin degradation protein MlrC